jgi:hypothetical protein
MKWQVVGASVVGTSHNRCALPCQDAHDYRITGDSVIAVLADGLGSAAKSAEGAKRAVSATLESLHSRLSATPPQDPDHWMHVMGDAFFQAREALRDLADLNSLPIQHFGTTLIAVALAKEWIAVGHLGDGAVVAAFDDAPIQTISAPERGEYANEVVSLTAADALGHVRFSVRHESVKGIALLTDGLQNLCINAATAEAFKPFFHPFFEAVVDEIDTQKTSEDLATFLGSEPVSSKTDDDTTLVIIGRISSS